MHSTAEITLYIHKDFRGQRVGKQLLDATLTEARVRGFHTIIGNSTLVTVMEQRILTRYFSYGLS